MTTVKKTFAQSQREQVMKERDLLPPLSESPFGPFPKNWSTPASEKVRTTTTTAAAASKRRPAAEESSSSTEGSAAKPRPPMLVSHTGTGGMSVSTFKGRGGARTALKDGRFGNPSGPGRAGAYDKQRIPPTEFRRHYERGDLPLSIQHAARRTLSWRVEVNKLDYHHYLPIFFDGLRELEEPYSFVALQGSMDLLEHGGSKILPTVPQLIIPLKTALSTRHPTILINVMKVMQKLVVSGEFVGEALVPYYRQLLPVLNLFKNRTKNLGDRMDYGQYKQRDLTDLINQTLNLLEQYGGEDAYINIKYMVPTYESCM